MLASLASCGGSSDAHDTQMKAGLVALHTSDSTYDKNFIDAFNAACKAEGVTPVIKTNIPETTAAYDAAADLADQGCKFVFADSFGHEAHILKAAKNSKMFNFHMPLVLLLIILMLATSTMLLLLFTKADISLVLLLASNFSL